MISIKEKLQVYFVKEHTFKPKIMNKSPITSKRVELDEDSWKYVKRLQSVKDQKEERMRRLNPDYSKN